LGFKVYLQYKGKLTIGVWLASVSTCRPVRRQMGKHRATPDGTDTAVVSSGGCDKDKDKVRTVWVVVRVLKRTVTVIRKAEKTRSNIY
jgi:hypothetical protein